MTQPLIILGMHRSGTSMLTRTLQSQGLFIGHRLGKHAEALFFHALNERILRKAGASWDRPAPLLQMMADADSVERLAEMLDRRMRGPRSWNYLGPRILRARASIGAHMPFAWGFKDPRSSLVLPVWLTLFPEARLLRIRRHGVDVAASLVARELRRAEPGRCRTIADGLELWSEYETAIDCGLALVPPDRQMTVRFEDYAADCAATQAAINAFAGLPLAGIVPPELRPAPERVMAYRGSAALRDAAAQFAPLLRKHGYQP